VEVVKEEEAIITDVETAEVEADVAGVEEVVVAEVVVVEKTWSRKTEEKQTVQAWSCRSKHGGRMAVEHMERVCAIACISAASALEQRIMRHRIPMHGLRTGYIEPEYYHDINLSS
jgi:hypothetical protein